MEEFAHSKQITDLEAFFDWVVGAHTSHRRAGSQSTDVAFELTLMHGGN
jgi:hypothetical protein